MVLSSRINLLALPLRVRYLIMVLGVKKFTAILCSRLGFCFFSHNLMVENRRFELR